MIGLGLLVALIGGFGAAAVIEHEFVARGIRRPWRAQAWSGVGLTLLLWYIWSIAWNHR